MLLFQCIVAKRRVSRWSQEELAALRRAFQGFTSPLKNDEVRALQAVCPQLGQRQLAQIKIRAWALLQNPSIISTFGCCYFCVFMRLTGVSLFFMHSFVLNTYNLATSQL